MRRTVCPVSAKNFSSSRIIYYGLGQPAPSTDGNSRCPAPFTDGYCEGENLRGIDTPVIKSPGFVARSRSLHEHTRTSRFKFNVIWHQFSTSQFPRHQFGKFVQVSSGNWGQVPPFCSVYSVHFTNSFNSGPDDQAGSVRPKLGSIRRVSNCLGGAEEQF